MAKLSDIGKSVTAPTLGDDIRQQGVQSKGNRAKDKTLRNLIMKLLLRRDPTVEDDRLESVRQIRRKPFNSLARYAKHVTQTCKRDAVAQRIERS